MEIVPENGEMFTIIGENHPDCDQSAYTVGRRRGRCSCADSEYRNAKCKHQRRVTFALGRESVPAALAPSEVPGVLGGGHLDGEPRFLATDADALAARGHGRRAVYHLPELDGWHHHRHRRVGR